MSGSSTPEFTPEFVSYSNGPILLAQTAPIYAIAAVVVLGRCYTRLMIVKSFGRDDWAMLATLVFATICFVAYTMEIHHGVGKHIAVIQSDEHGYAQLLKWRMVHMVVVGLGLAMVKISVCLFLLRLATRRAYCWFLWGVIAFLVPFASACALTLIFQCNPVAAAWHVKLLPPPLGTGTAKCFSPSTFDAIGLFNGVVNITTDFMLALLPVPLIWKLQMPLRTRISLVAVLSLGIFAAIAGIIRQLSSSQFGIPEPYIHDTYSIWNFIELDMGIVAASLPSLRPLFSWLGDAARSISGRTAKTTGYKSRIGAGYQRRARPSDGEAFDMTDYGSGGDVKISSGPTKRVDNWTLDGAKSSEESILPREERVKSGIVVTKSVQVR